MASSSADNIEASDASVIRRGTRHNTTNYRVKKLSVRGYDQGEAPIEAVRKVMFGYQPARVVLTKMLDANFPREKEKIMAVSHKVLTKGEIDCLTDIPHLLSLLDTILGVFQELAKNEVQLRRTMRNVDDFLPHGRVLKGLENAVQDISNFVDDEGEGFSEDDEILEVPTTADESALPRGQLLKEVETNVQGGSCYDAESSEDEDTIVEASPKRKLSAASGRQRAKIRAILQREHPVTPLPKRTQEPLMEEQTPRGRRKEEIEEEDVFMGGKDDGEDMESESASSILYENTQPTRDGNRGNNDADTTLKRGAKNIEKFKMKMGEDLNPDVYGSSDEDTPKRGKHRLPRGEERFLLGPIDPRAHCRFIHGGPAPFTEKTATAFKKRLEAATKAVGGDSSKANISALKAFDPSEKARTFGPGGLGFQLLSKPVDTKESKMPNPCNPNEFVRWNYATEFSDSQTRYIPWFMLAMKMYQRDSMVEAVHDKACGTKRKEAAIVWAEANMEKFKGGVMKEIEEDRKQVLYMLETYFSCITRHNEKKMAEMGGAERGEKGKAE
jgi:hypothetical protein